MYVLFGLANAVQPAQANNGPKVTGGSTTKIVEQLVAQGVAFGENFKDSTF